MAGKHLDDLVSIVGVHGSKEQPFSIQGSAELSEGNGHVDLSKAQLGKVNLLLTVRARISSPLWPMAQALSVFYSSPSDCRPESLICGL